jgi:hypothetical protein
MHPEHEGDVDPFHVLSNEMVTPPRLFAAVADLPPELIVRRVADVDSPAAVWTPRYSGARFAGLA